MKNEETKRKYLPPWLCVARLECTDVIRTSNEATDTEGGKLDGDAWDT